MAAVNESPIETRGDLMCKLADSLGVVIDQMLEVTGHGKDEADGHGGVFKQWLTNEMQRADVEMSDADLMEVADQVDGQEASFATAMTKRARDGFAELKPAGMNSKRRERSNKSKRVFKTYTEADIRDAPHDNCVRAESFERRNDWKLVELKPWATRTSSTPTQHFPSCSATTVSPWSCPPPLRPHRRRSAAADGPA